MTSPGPLTRTLRLRLFQLKHITTRVEAEAGYEDKESLISVSLYKVS